MGKLFLVPELFRFQTAMRSLVFASAVSGVSANLCCYEGYSKAPTSCNDAGNWCSASSDNCGSCGGDWCGDSPSPPAPPPTPPGPPPAGLKLYCPTADDLTIAYCDEGPNEDMG